MTANPDTPNAADGELFEDSFYNWLLKNGFDVWVKGSEMTNSSLGNSLTGELDMTTLKAAIQAYTARKVLEGRIDENKTYWWHQQKFAEKEGISKHALDRIAALSAPAPTPQPNQGGQSHE